MAFMETSICLLTILIVGGESYNIEFKKNPSTSETWTGRWFPGKPTESPVPVHLDTRIPMGEANRDCDDAQLHLEVDWIDDPVNYTCYDHLSEYGPNRGRRPIYEIENIPPSYMAAHVCMNESISYDQIIPTFGSHRALWPKWGEYQFVPKQRWLHNLEHGGLVMLYHPCANRGQVKVLRTLVKNCLYRHIITPYNLLSPERPLALVAWGRRLQMSVVSKIVVVEFIKEAALNGPEHTAKQGQYSHGLLQDAKVVSTQTDDFLCPNL